MQLLYGAVISSSLSRKGGNSEEREWSRVRVNYLNTTRWSRQLHTGKVDAAESGAPGEGRKPTRTEGDGIERASVRKAGLNNQPIPWTLLSSCQRVRELCGDVANRAWIYPNVSSYVGTYI